MAPSNYFAYCFPVAPSSELIVIYMSAHYIAMDWLPYPLQGHDFVDTQNSPIFEIL